MKKANYFFLPLNSNTRRSLLYAVKARIVVKYDTGTANCK